MKISHLQVNHLTEPLGYDLLNPGFSWIPGDCRGTRQKWARVRVALDSDMENLVHDSGVQENLDSLSYCPPLSLEPRTRYYWDVTVTDDAGDSAAACSFFETSKMEEPWEGKWISSAENTAHAVFFGEKELSQQIVSARAYVSGLGIYEFYINGEKVGSEYLQPGFNDYHFWVQYQTYDVTDLLKTGDNRLGAMVGPGWYCGRFGFQNETQGHFGSQTYFLCEIHAALADGSEVVFGSDESWKWAASPVLESSIYDGEVYDARMETDDWCRPGTALPGTADVLLAAPPRSELHARLSLPVTVQEQFPNPQLIHTPKDEWVLDFGQEVTGWVEFHCNLPRGQKVRLQYFEILQDGCFYNDNLRSAKAEYTFLSAGKPAVVRPHFTFYGFRYVKIEGLEPPDPRDFTACVLHSQLEMAGKVETSDPRVNRLFLNALWGQKGNFLDVPTDCPQRDERMGWTGDAQIFCGTASFNMDTAAFYRKYMHDMLLEQENVYHGSVPHVVPMVITDPKLTQHGSCAWADVAAVIPWQQYLFYGDKTLLAQQYPNMKAWTDYLRREQAENGGRPLRQTGAHFADWLALDNPDKTSRHGGTDPYFIASAYFYLSVLLTAKAAEVLKKDEAAELYLWAEEIRQAFREEYLLPGGDNVCKTQTSYVVSLMFHLVPEEDRTGAARLLREKLKENKIHLTTGFVGTPYLCRVLSDTDQDDYAYRLLMNDDYPSWLYEVKMGATTVWERWNSVLPDGSMNAQGVGMNSLNHYAYGSIAEWMYRDMCGLNPGAPGFRKAILRPHPDRSLEFARAEYRSAVGLYRAGWAYEGDQIHYSFTVPFGAEAELLLPGEAEVRHLKAGSWKFTCKA